MTELYFFLFRRISTGRNATRRPLTVWAWRKLSWLIAARKAYGRRNFGLSASYLRHFVWADRFKH